ncbi:serine/threonine-protein kinase [Streptosporangium album]|uniref:non-specific serine/threonine protein kinase n=1 Tax=Streptosporangium album TaxID=47479 RepID=A0A7W7RR71_9ACTN|nr:serine/threonine-protein kinase [Streptosporangium album]MBB4936710.1 serine/threonine-protein kinase [Streptosporangium album]
MYGMPSAWRVPGYTEIRELGVGAAGRVVMARHDADDILVAIKYLSDELRSDVGFVARFRHEARVLNTLDSPHAVRLYDYIESGEGAAIVMELVDGVSLRALLRSEGPTGPEAALLVLKGALLGLATAHTAGIVHRDFKPENVMVESDGTSRLVDFGIAIRSGDGDTPAGTPPYMAPEQWAGAPAGPSTDVYAATVVFFECLTGTRPFRATNLAALARQHQSMPPPVEEVPSALQGLVERGLAKHPADRPPTATAFLTELEAVAADAYGPEWQERGRRRLAGLVAILASLLPLEIIEPETSTSLARTEFGGHSATSTSDSVRTTYASGRKSVLRKTSTKFLIGLGCIAVISGVSVVLVNASDSTPIQAQSVVSTPSVSPSSEPVESVIPDDETDEPTQEPTAESTPAPTQSTSTAASPPPAVPSARPTSAPTPSPTHTGKPTKKPTKKPTSAPAPSEDSSPLDIGDSTPTRSPSARPTPTRTTRPTTPQPTASSSSSSTPTGSEGTPTASEPTNGGESPSGQGTPQLTSSPTPPIETVPAAVLLFGLMTGGAVPFTLAVKRGMAGRRRRRR